MSKCYKLKTGSNRRQVGGALPFKKGVRVVPTRTRKEKKKLAKLTK